MDVAEVAAMVERVRRTVGDNEAAHGLEDDLHISVLQAIADGDLSGDDAQAAATIALTTRAIEYDRWYA